MSSWFRRRQPIVSLALILFLIAMASCASPRARYLGAFGEADELYEKGKYEDAITKYQEYLKDTPEGSLSVIAQYYIAKSHQKLGHITAARPLYQEIMTHHADTKWAEFAKQRLREMEEGATT